MTAIKRIILDVLKPHAPSIIEVAERLGGLEGITGVTITLDETDAETDTIKITIEGNNIIFENIKQELSDCGASIHSIDGVSAGMKIIEDVNTPQDR